MDSIHFIALAKMNLKPSLPGIRLEHRRRQATSVLYPERRRLAAIRVGETILLREVPRIQEFPRSR